MRKMATGFALAAALVAMHATRAAESPRVNANGTATDDVAETDSGGDQDAELAKELQNPVANLISVPFQNNFDFNLGPRGDGFKYTLNFQPVIPVSLGNDWNLIIRTIVPIVS